MLHSSLLKEHFDLEFFVSLRVNYQTPHEKDEFYIIFGGASELAKESETVSC